MIYAQNIQIKWKNLVKFFNLDHSAECLFKVVEEWSNIACYISTNLLYLPLKLLSTLASPSTNFVDNLFEWSDKFASQFLLYLFSLQTLDLTDSIGIISLQIDELPSAPALDASTKIPSPIIRNQTSRKNSFEPMSRLIATPLPAESTHRGKAQASKVDRIRSTPIERSFCDRSTNPSPTHSVSNATTSPIDNFSISREYALKHEIEVLQEKLKDTEERLQSLRIQHDSLSHLHRDLRESHTRLQEESELLKLDVQHLTECANILRSELQAARNDRNEALDVQKLLQAELEESRADKKRIQEQSEKDAKIIQDLHRQCREMERILMRKHPDSVSALIGKYVEVRTLVSNISGTKMHCDLMSFLPRD